MYAVHRSLKISSRLYMRCLPCWQPRWRILNFSTLIPASSTTTSLALSPNAASMNNSVASAHTRGPTEYMMAKTNVTLLEKAKRCRHTNRQVHGTPVISSRWASWVSIDWPHWQGILVFWRRVWWMVLFWDRIYVRESRLEARGCVL